jgi:DNA-binding NtrC family response regulator
VSASENINQGQWQGDNDTASVLIIHNEPEVVASILKVLARKGIRGCLVKDEKSALEFLENSRCDLVFCDERFPKHLSPKQPSRKPLSETGDDNPDGNGPTRWTSGIELVQRIRTALPELPIIMIGQYHSDRQTPIVEASKKASASDVHRAVAAATEAVRQGCYDFIVRPVAAEKIEHLLNTFLPNRRVSTIESSKDEARGVYRIVGRSPSLIKTVEVAKKLAGTSVAVLISGESGTGKELISYLVHQNSRRANMPYVRINCAALNDSLLESELFGHEKGAFTGAHCRRQGRFETANGGTLLLDEISETPPGFQAKLLRVLEQQDFERVGGNENIKVNVRIISTTNKELLKDVQQGRFRRDLYYRLSGVRLAIPALRERKEDLPDLVWHFVNLYARETQRHITRLDPVMMDIFAKYHWPGNVRQLRNVVRTSLILATGETLSLADVSWLLDETSPGGVYTTGGPNTAETTGEQAKKHPCFEYASVESSGDGGRLGGLPLEQIERQAILETLHRTSGNQTKAAKVLGISDRTLREKIRRYRQQGCLQPV